MAAQPNDPRIAAFKQEHENTLFGFIDDCDRRIRASQRKLEKTPEENRKTMDLVSGQFPCVEMITFLVRRLSPMRMIR